MLLDLKAFSEAAVGHGLPFHKSQAGMEIAGADLVFLVHFIQPSMGEQNTFRRMLYRFEAWGGKLKKLGLEKPPADESLEIEAHPAGRRPSANWAKIIRRVYEIDPLVCPESGAGMRLIAVIDDEFVVRKILKHLSLWEEPRTRAPPEPEQPLDIEYVPFLD